ncbi:MAG: ATP-binding protein [Lachnospiraceae bacterium]|nr:ATP-binding protein [Lachnospiraceae bacterium]
MYRDIVVKLEEWKNSKRRKPLLLTGVRQCGKTYVLKEFGQQNFENVCYINFESNEKYAEIFEYDYDVERIIKEIEFIENIKINCGKTLIIFDEIQEVPRAITALKYFCENKKELHVACAGSLLGVILKQKNISFPVGKVNRLQMYPMSFREFLIASGEEKYIELFKEWPVEREIPQIYTKPLERLLKEYYIVGGMPEVVSEYIENSDFSVVADIQNEILSDYADDFSKHVPVSDIEKIRMIWDSIPKQLAKENNKFVFSHVKEGKRAHELESSLQWLKNAGLINIVEQVSNAEIPLSANANATHFKVYMSDTGLLSRRLGISSRSLLEDDTLTTIKGAVTENYVLNELLVCGKNPYFWRSGNSAEVDFLFEEEGDIYPVEVKAATNTQAKSYKQFVKKFNAKMGFKISMKNIAVNNVENTNTISLPLYLLWNLSYILKREN